MVFGWGKKKKEEKQESEPRLVETDISISKVTEIISENKALRTKQLLSEVNLLKDKMIPELDELLHIAKELEKDSLKVDDIDKHLRIIVVRGKSQVISILKKETSKKLADSNSIEDAIKLSNETSGILKRIGEVLGRQTRVIHIFAKKYANQLKTILPSLNSNNDQIKKLLQNYNETTKNIEDVNELLEKISNSYTISKKNNSRINELTNSSIQIESELESLKKDIEKLTSTEEYKKHLEIKKEIDNLSLEQNKIKNKIDQQFTKVSRPLSKYSYISSLDKEQKTLMEKLIENPFDVLTAENKNDIIIILQAVRKGVQAGSVSVKDTEKAIQQIDETTEMLGNFIQKISNFQSKKESMKKNLDIFDISKLKQKQQDLEKQSTKKTDIQNKIKTLENEISESKRTIPQNLIDMEIKLKTITGIKYKISS